MKSLRCFYMCVVKKEATGLQNMIDKHRENPNFGPTKKMEGELKVANQKIKNIETELEGLRSYHENLINYTSNNTLRLVPDRVTYF